MSEHKKPNKWQKHLKAYMNKHNCSLKDAMVGAKETYVKKGKEVKVIKKNKTPIDIVFTDEEEYQPEIYTKKKVKKKKENKKQERIKSEKKKENINELFKKLKLRLADAREDNDSDDEYEKELELENEREERKKVKFNTKYNQTKDIPAIDSKKKTPHKIKRRKQ